MRLKSAVLASAVAGLFLAGGTSTALAQQPEGEKVKCEGVNSCKGKSACKGATNDCKGKNACEGRGFLMMTPEECAKAQKAVEDQEEEE